MQSAAENRDHCITLSSASSFASLTENLNELSTRINHLTDCISLNASCILTVIDSLSCISFNQVTILACCVMPTNSIYLSRSVRADNKPKVAHTTAKLAKKLSFDVKLILFAINVTTHAIKG